MASISSTSSSLGNTALRGYGGMASGIDRDSIIEQMTLATTTKIQNQKNSITSLEWKQEAYRSISDKIIDFQDNYLYYSSSQNLTDASTFAKNIITALGDDSATKFVSATGSSDMLDYMSLMGVEQLATAANLQSAAKASGAITTNLKYEYEEGNELKTSNLEGRTLIFGTSVTEGQFQETGTFTFSSSYTDENGDTVNIDYTQDLDSLAKALNYMIKATKFEVQDDTTIQFSYNEDSGNMTLQYCSVKKTGTDGFEVQGAIEDSGSLVIRSSSTALTALGFNSSADGIEKDDSGYGYTLSTLNTGIGAGDQEGSYVTKYDTGADYLAGRTFTFSYGGQTKSINLVSEEDLDSITSEDDLLQVMNDRLAKAFGSGKIVAATDEDGNITFNTTDDSMTLTVTSDYDTMEQTGLDQMSSNKISLGNSLWENKDRLGFDAKTEEELNDLLANFTINGVKIEGLDSDTTVSELISKINSSDAGVKANYLSGSNKFTLIATETGSGREITVDGAASTIFGGGTSKDGTDAVIYVNYGTGDPEKVVSSTNTFDLSGLEVTVSGTFGVEKTVDENGKEKLEFDTSKSVTFNAKANVDSVVEMVKKFLEDYNAIVDEVHTQITTKPDSDYGPLTDDQKDEMTETSIENWEKKAKEGLLYNDSTVRDLSMDLEGMLNKLYLSGVTYDDLEEIGITPSSDIYDGGTLTFDETKFRAAMEKDPEKVGRIFAGGGSVTTGLTSAMKSTLQEYATRYAYQNNGSYGRLVEEAGSEKVTLSLQNNTIYKQLQDMKEVLEQLQTKLETEQDRYIQQFTTMETAISNMNSQSSYLSSLTG